jgi:putative heme-binding domain-containing protein
MPRSVVPRALSPCCVFAILFFCLPAALPADDSGLSWIWTPEARSTSALPEGARWFRKTFTIDRPIANPVDETTLEITADNSFVVWFNGVEVGSGSQWQRIYRFDLKKHAKHGKNVLAVAATNESESPAALLVHLTFTPNGKTKEVVNSDSSWKCSQKEPVAGWQNLEFDDQAWEKAFPIGLYGKTQPWGAIQWDDAPTSSRFKVPDAFVVETVIPPTPQTQGLDPRLPFSLINMTFDAKGRLLVSQERGPVLLCTKPDDKGQLQSIKPYCKQVKNAQGLCWVRDALFVVGDGPQGTGLYRAKDTQGRDETDEVTLVHKFKGGMGEHGPHAILHGPDDSLYLVIGNHAWAQPKPLAANSPLTRWPTGTFGPDQGDPRTTEDVLLPRLNDGRGHAANILAPGGTIWRMDHDGKNLSLVAAGFRNHFDAAFRSDGELFTFDSDMEWDEGMPWYRPVRVCHCPPGADYVWRTGASNTPNYYLDSLPPLLETGRGSPVGVTFYEHDCFPAQYQGAFFMGDWSLGIIWAAHLQPQGASFKGQVEKFCVGAPLNVTDLEVGPDGALYFTLGGRGTAGGVYRIRYSAKLPKEVQGQQPLAAWSPARSKWKSPASPTREACLQALHSKNALEQRHACENLIRFGYEPPVDALWPLLSGPDRFLRTAARLVLQRIEPAKWIDRLQQSDDLPALEGIVALGKTNQASRYSQAIYDRLAKLHPSDQPDVQLQQLRTWQLAFIHAPADENKKVVEVAVKHWFDQFPSSNWRVNRELAILLTHAGRTHSTTLPVQEKLLGEMIKTGQDRQQQIYYFYCLRLLHEGWTAAQKQQLLTWFDQTGAWSGGHSFTPFMENIFKDWAAALSPAERTALLSQAQQFPHVAAVLIQLPTSTALDPAKLVALFGILSGRNGESAQSGRNAILSKLSQSLENPDTQKTLRLLADRFPDQADMVARALSKAPCLENLPYLLRGLASTSPLVLRDCVTALQQIPFQPKPEESAPYRSVLLALRRLGERDRPGALELLRHWKAQRFSSDDQDVATELIGWTRWFGQAFPKEPPLPNAAALTAESKWKFEDLRKALETARGGESARGKLIFTKANCIKCHKFGSEGEGIGPDLTTLKSRFQRADVLEAILYPSKTISDQYRGSVIVTQSGQTLTGLAAPQGDTITVLQIDGTKAVVKKSDVESQIASTLSPMPEKLLDDLTLQEIIDLFAYLDSPPK